MVDNAIPEQMLADAGYDLEANHTLLREGLGIESTIPHNVMMVDEEEGFHRA